VSVDGVERVAEWWMPSLCRTHHRGMGQTLHGSDLQRPIKAPAGVSRTTSGAAYVFGDEPYPPAPRPARTRIGPPAPRAALRRAAVADGGHPPLPTLMPGGSTGDAGVRDRTPPPWSIAPAIHSRRSQASDVPRHAVPPDFCGTDSRDMAQVTQRCCWGDGPDVRPGMMGR
jgi:hypothetical protein